jgi:hypothetical protein
LRATAAHAKDFAGSKRLLSTWAASVEKRFQVAAADQEWPSIRCGWQAILDPLTHGVSADAKQRRDFRDRVIPV